jgi:hypothetical protein
MDRPGSWLFWLSAESALRKGDTSKEPRGAVWAGVGASRRRWGAGLLVRVLAGPDRSEETVAFAVGSGGEEERVDWTVLDRSVAELQ